MRKRIIGIVLVIALCIGLALPVTASSSDIIPEITIRIPGSDALFTLENVSAQYVLTTNRDGLPNYRFAFPGMSGRVSANKPANLNFTSVYETGFGGGEGESAAGWYFVPWIDASEDDPITFILDIFICQDGSLTWCGNPVAVVSFFMGFPVTFDDFGFNYPEDLISFEWVDEEMVHATLPKHSVSDLAYDDEPQQPDLSTASDWAREDITKAIELGLVPQALQNYYTQATTRAEFAALVVYLYETVTGREIATDRSIAFSDTTDVNVHKAATIGVVMGVGENRFDPDAQLTREQAAVMLARLAYAIGQPLEQADATFYDNADVSDWAVDAVGQMQESGIMGGVGNNLFSPGGDYTREQSIVTILRLFDILD